MSENAQDTTKRAQEILEHFSRFGLERAGLAAGYILAADPTVVRTEIAENLYSSLQSGGSRGEAVFALEFLLEVLELRAAEPLRPSNWDDLASQLPGIAHHTGGE